MLVDPARNIKTQIDSIRLERLSVSLAAWARKSDDRLVRWAGGPDFGEGMTESHERIELVGPRVRYAIEFTAPPTTEAASIYRRFADTAILLKAARSARWSPPFPRLAINRRVAAAGASLPTCRWRSIPGRPWSPVGPKRCGACISFIHGSSPLTCLASKRRRAGWPSLCRLNSPSLQRHRCQTANKSRRGFRGCLNERLSGCGIVSRGSGRSTVRAPHNASCRCSGRHGQESLPDRTMFP